jgi:hypothetical protein
MLTKKRLVLLDSDALTNVQQRRRFKTYPKAKENILASTQSGQEIDVPETLIEFRDRLVNCAENQPKQKFTATKWKDKIGKIGSTDVVADLLYIRPISWRP